MATRGRPEVAEVVRWYFDEGRVEGLPFYCDPIRIGAFAIEPDELAAGTDAAVFRLFVTLSMYQALRDVMADVPVEGAAAQAEKMLAVSTTKSVIAALEQALRLAREANAALGATCTLLEESRR